MTSVAQKADPTPEQAALASVNDLLKLLTSLATGALVFSVGLIAPSSSLYPAWAKWTLSITWALFLVAAACGVYAQSLVPLQIRKSAENINAPELRGAAMLLEACFLLGILGLAITLVVTLFGSPNRQAVVIATPLQAIRGAEAKVRRSYSIVSIDSVEFLKGVDSARLEQGAWHVRFKARANAPARASTESTVDVYLDPVSSQIYVLTRK